MHRSNGFLALALSLLFLGGNIEAATLRGSFFFDGKPGKLSVQVTQGRITAVDITVPEADLPPPYDVFDYGTPTTYNGAPGREFEEILSASLTSKAVLRYSNISRSSAREFQSEAKTYSYAGTQTRFYPDDHSTSIVTARILLVFHIRLDTTCSLRSARAGAAVSGEGETHAIRRAGFASRWRGGVSVTHPEACGGSRGGGGFSPPSPA